MTNCGKCGVRISCCTIGWDCIPRVHDTQVMSPAAHRADRLCRPHTPRLVISVEVAPMSCLKRQSVSPRFCTKHSYAQCILISARRCPPDVDPTKKSPSKKSPYVANPDSADKNSADDASCTPKLIRQCFPLGLHPEVRLTAGLRRRDCRGGSQRNSQRDTILTLLLVRVFAILRVQVQEARSRVASHDFPVSIFVR